MSDIEQRMERAQMCLAEAGYADQVVVNEYEPGRVGVTVMSGLMQENMHMAHAVWRALNLADPRDDAVCWPCWWRGILHPYTSLAPVHYDWCDHEFDLWAPVEAAMVS